MEVKKAKHQLHEKFNVYKREDSHRGDADS
jgi:hypothetical protein